MPSHDYTVDLSTANFEIKIHPSAGYGYFEHNELGDECGGGLWFTSCPPFAGELVDYDGVTHLPKEVDIALRANNYYLDDTFD
jgi:hypothetical protein